MTQKLQNIFDDTNKKPVKLAELYTLFATYKEGIENEEIPHAYIPAVLKELKNLMGEVETVSGMLNEEQDLSFENIKDDWFVLCENQGVSEDQIDQTELLFKTSTGKEKALPVYQRRFDA
jgi:hypothetical protein